jgi:hypothetical protein
MMDRRYRSGKRVRQDAGLVVLLFSAKNGSAKFWVDPENFAPESRVARDRFNQSQIHILAVWDVPNEFFVSPFFFLMVAACFLVLCYY